MKKIELTIPNEILIRDYLELSSSYKVAKKYNVSATAVKRVLKELGVLRTQSESARIRNKNHPNFGRYERTSEHRKILSECAKNRKPYFKGRKHTDEAKSKIGEASKKRTGKRNPNYKNGKYIRRPRDYKIHELTKLRKVVFNRDNFECKYCSTRGGHLHAHHLIPFWAKPEAFLDVENLITVCTKCHFTKAHLGNWQSFDITFIKDDLLIRYSFCRERLNELATFTKKVDATV